MLLAALPSVHLPFTWFGQGSQASWEHVARGTSTGWEAALWGLASCESGGCCVEHGLVLLPDNCQKAAVYPELLQQKPAGELAVSF